MKKFAFEIFEAQAISQLKDQLNQAGTQGFEIKHIFREGILWMAVLQEELGDDSGFISPETATRAETVSPKTENL